MAGDIWQLLGINLLVVLGFMSVLAVPSLRTKDPSYVDGIWGLAFVVLAGASWLQTDGDPARQAVLIGLCLLWGVRLSVHLLQRWRRNGPDPRYQRMLGPDPSPASIWLRVFVLQALILMVIALPVQLGQVYSRPVGLAWWNVLGAVVALAGIVIESLADLQLTRFKADPANHGKVMDRGLWHYSRHPNYFGESVTWWGLGLVAWCNAVTALALLGPLLVTFLLLRVSGVGLLESSLKQTKPGYGDYVATTSAFVPRPPRRR